MYKYIFLENPEAVRRLLHLPHPEVQNLPHRRRVADPDPGLTGNASDRNHRLSLDPKNLQGRGLKNLDPNQGKRNLAQDHEVRGRDQKAIQ